MASSVMRTPWKSSYFSFKPRRMAMASSLEGSFTKTGWKRRVSAGSRSIYFWYSLIVVAPIALSSPRANAGFNIFEASMDPSEAPAPTKVWISSMKRMTLPSERSTSFKIFFNLSSNSPRYFVPAMREPRSREINSLSLRDSGISPWAMRNAKPSTIAVFPTPASPIRIGLFFVLLDNIWIMRMISLSRPITGSSLFSLASLVRLRAYLYRVLNFFGSPSLAPAGADFSSCITWVTRSRSILNLARISLAWQLISKIDRNRCSVEMNSSFIAAITLIELSSICAKSGVM